MGARRARIARHAAATRLVVLVDQIRERAEGLSQQHGCDAAHDWQAVIARPDVDIVVVSTFHNSLALISAAALRAGKHVLCEKPAAMSRTEARELRAVAEQSERRLQIGFNYRFLPAVRRARVMATEGCIGELIYLRGELGHGGRPGYEKEWRATPQLGGGAALDPGVHIVDLTRWFLGEITGVQSMTRTFCWDMAPLDDNAFILAETAAGRAASLHISLTQWKNRFRFELYGQTGFLSVEGRGGSYGPQTLTWCRERPKGQAPPMEQFRFDEHRDAFDYSLECEWRDFLEAIPGCPAWGASIGDAERALAVVETVYRAAESQRMERVESGIG
jgi:predicted dehydrogenase